jgi:hypothetical protein
MSTTNMTALQDFISENHQVIKICAGLSYTNKYASIIIFVYGLYKQMVAITGIRPVLSFQKYFLGTESDKIQLTS